MVGKADHHSLSEDDYDEEYASQEEHEDSDIDSSEEEVVAATEVKDYIEVASQDESEEEE